MKKGISTQIFIWIFAMVVLGVIIYFGFDMINKTWCFGKGVDVVKFNQDFEDEVREVYLLSKGSNKKIELNVPSEYDEICFFDRTKSYNANKITNNEIKEIIELDQSMNNVFFVSDDKCVDEEPQLVEHLLPYENPICFDIRKSNRIFKRQQMFN